MRHPIIFALCLLSIMEASAVEVTTRANVVLSGEYIVQPSRQEGVFVLDSPWTELQFDFANEDQVKAHLSANLFNSEQSQLVVSHQSLQVGLLPNYFAEYFRSDSPLYKINGAFEMALSRWAYLDYSDWGLRYQLDWSPMKITVGVYRGDQGQNKDRNYNQDYDLAIEYAQENYSLLIGVYKGVYEDVEARRNEKNRVMLMAKTCFGDDHALSLAYYEMSDAADGAEEALSHQYDMLPYGGKMVRGSGGQVGLKLHGELADIWFLHSQIQANKEDSQSWIYSSGLGFSRALSLTTQVYLAGEATDFGPHHQAQIKDTQRWFIASIISF